MNTIFRKGARVLAVVVVGWLGGAGCQTVPAHDPGAEAAARQAVAQVSAKPGINAEFLKPALKTEEWVERFESEGREVFARRHEIVAAMGVAPGAVVADVGAGTGLFVPLLVEATGPSGRVLAVDLVPDFLALIRKRSVAAGWGNVETVLCTERSVNLPAGSVDVVFVCDTYHHFEYPQSSLASIHRALRPGGVLVLVDFKRVPGLSSEWILKHVRAGQEVFTAEIEAAGFVKLDEPLMLKENYVVRFRKR